MAEDRCGSYYRCREKNGRDNAKRRAQIIGETHCTTEKRSEHTGSVGGSGSTRNGECLTRWVRNEVSDPDAVTT
jgi:hypothetical protein